MPESLHDITPIPGSIIALLLPGYSPGLAWMARALNADRVILDDLHPFSRKGKVHRTKIRTPDGHQWLTIPFVSEDRRKPINKVRIDHRRPWLRHHLQALEYNYRNSPYFDFYEPEIRVDFETASENVFLLDAVRHLMQRQWLYLELSEFAEWASELVGKNNDPVYMFNPSGTHSGEPENSERGDNTSGNQASGIQVQGSQLHESFPSTRVSSEKRVTVWQEPDSRNYQIPHPHAERTDSLESVFHIPEYRQHFSGFIPGCGLFDLLFEYGPDSWQILDELRIEVRRK